MKWYCTDQGLTIVGKETSVILSCHPQFEEIKRALHDPDFSEEALLCLLDPQVIEMRKKLLQ
jgi:hypothetical protein